VFGFDHDTGELLRARVAEDDAAVFAEGIVGFGNGAGDFRKRVERRLGSYFHVEDSLRVVLEACDEGIETAIQRDERSDFYGGEKAIAGRGIFQKNDVAGLFATENVAALEHFFEDVAVADVGAGQGYIFAGENTFEAEIGHGGGNDAIAGKLFLGFEVASDGKEYAITVDDFPIGRNE